MTAACPLAVGIAVFILHEGEGIDIAIPGINSDTLANTIETIRIVESKTAFLFFNFILSYFLIGDTILLILFKSLLHTSQEKF